MSMSCKTTYYLSASEMRVKHDTLCQITVSAIEQLQVMSSKRQYKEAAAQLEVSYFMQIP